MKRLIAIILLLSAVVWINIGGEESPDKVDAGAEESASSSEETYEFDPDVYLEYVSEHTEELNFNVNHMSDSSTIHLSDDLSIDINDGIIALVNVGEDGELFDVPNDTSTPIIALDIGIVNTGDSAEDINISGSTLITSTGERLDAVELYEVNVADTIERGSVEYGGVTFLLRDSMPTHIEWADWYVEYDGGTHQHRIEFDGYTVN